jgi:hypothetical protein
MRRSACVASGKVVFASRTFFDGQGVARDAAAIPSAAMPERSFNDGSRLDCFYRPWIAMRTAAPVRAEPAIITRSSFFIADFSDFAIVIPRGIDASGRHIPYQCVQGVAAPKGMSVKRRREPEFIRKRLVVV